MINRREFIKGMAALGAASALPSCSIGNRPLSSRLWKPLPENDLPFAGLATSLPQEHAYDAPIEGTLPADLQGTLYRNGPGLFDRGAYRKRMLLDGDGMIQAFQFRDGRVRYQNRFVRTEKYLKEEEAGEFLYPTWATQAPGGISANLGVGIMNQAGVTVVRRKDRLFAFDEGFLPYELDPETLETRGMSDLGAGELSGGYKAHWKIDGTNGDWLHFGTAYGRKTRLEIVIFKKDGGLRRQWTVEIPRRVYMHDWLVSERHLIFILQPGIIPMSQVLRMVLGLIRPVSAIRWKPELGNLVLLVDRQGKEKPFFLEAEASWMWHALNAYEEKGLVIADFAGSRHPLGIGSDDAPFFLVMEGRDPGARPESEGPLLRRYVIDPGAKTLRQEVLVSNEVVEFPFVNPGLSCHRHRYGYFACLSPTEWFPTRVIRVDTHNGNVASYDFGRGHYCSEPVFASKPGFPYEAGSGEEPGWILTLVYQADTKRSYLAVLQADRLPAGPLAVIRLHHHAPLSFHGYWHGET